MGEYRLARTYEEQGYKINEDDIYMENGKRYAEAFAECWKCGGRGRIYYYAHVDRGICFACNGAGRMYKRVRVYTEAEREKMDAAAERKKQRELEKQFAEAPAKIQAWLDKYNITDKVAYIVTGCNTYEIKDELKNQGAKFYSGLGWFFGADTLPAEKENWLPETAFIYPANIDDIMYWTEIGRGPYYKDGALDEMNNDIKRIIAEKNQEKYGVSHHVGEIGQRLRNMSGTFVSAKFFEGQWGGNFIYTFRVGEDIFTWFSQSVIDNEIEPGDAIILTGTVKNHTEYNGVLQTQLSRCIVKKG